MTQPTPSFHLLLTSFTSTMLYHMGWNVLSKVGTMHIEKVLGGGNWLKIVSVAKGIIDTASSAPVRTLTESETLANACPLSSMHCAKSGMRRKAPTWGGEDKADSHLLFFLPHPQCGAMGTYLSQGLPPKAWRAIWRCRLVSRTSSSSLHLNNLA